MVNQINTWAQSIIVSVIIVVIIEMIVPKGNNKKYIKVVLALYIMLSIVYPIVKIIKNSNKDIDLNQVIKTANKEIGIYENENIAVNTNSYIEKTYKENLKENIKKELKEKGFNLLDIDVIVETKNENEYGKITSLSISIEKIENKNIKSINGIEDVNISIGNTRSKISKTNDLNSISEEEIKNIKDYLKNTYSLEEGKIHINENL